MAVSVQVSVSESLYLRDPQSTTLGRNIIQNSIVLINELGLEAFTFKKLGAAINSTEASVYRYFPNKHLLLAYLVGYYWEWVRYRIDFNTMNVDDPHRKIQIAIKTIVDTIRLATPAYFIDRDALHQLVVLEGSKAFHIKELSEQEKQGLFQTLQLLNDRIAGIILEINPAFPYPKAAASELLEMANNHYFYANHLPFLTDIKLENNRMNELEQMMEHFISKWI